MKNIELYICDVLKNSTGETVIIAVPSNKLPVQVGDVFRLKYEIERSLNDILQELPPSQTKVNTAQIDLVVEKIDVMRQLVNQLPAGMTGGLYLSGSGLAHVVPKCFLRTS
jgi:hypothetical protein